MESPMHRSPSAVTLRFTLTALALSLAASLPIVAADSSSSPPATEIAIVSKDEAVQSELLKLDRLLETNPKLEEALRTNLDQLTQATFRAKNPEVDALLKRQPGLVRALNTERHFFVHRWVARIAPGRVTRKDVVALDEFLSAHPDIAKALHRQPTQLVEGQFLIEHPPLAKFFEAHPALSSVLLERGDKKSDPKAPKKKK
jgi:hypothetical protein